jgi:hypothetical protein
MKISIKQIRQLIKEELQQSNLNELSPEFLQRAAEKSKEIPGREVQTTKFQIGSEERRIAEILKNFDSFQNKEINVYFQFEGEYVKELGITKINITKDELLEVNILLKKSNKISKFYKINLNKIKVIYNKEGVEDIKFYDIENNYEINFGIDMAGAQLLTKIVKTYNPESTLTPNTILGEKTKIANKAFEYPSASQKITKVSKPIVPSTEESEGLQEIRKMIRNIIKDI